MKPQHVIYQSGSGVVLYTWDRQQYVPVAGYGLPDGDPAPLVTYLRQTPAAVVAIVVDVLEEEHQRTTLPRLGRRDQSAMLARKLARAFPRTSYRTAAVQGSTAEDPHTSRVLLSGLSQTEHLATLQALLAEARLPVSMVCSPALLSKPLLDRLRPANPADATLLVSRQREGSLRLSFFRGRDLVGSRLMRQALAAPPGDFPRLVRQLEESVRYFDAAFAPSASNPIDVLLLCEPGVDPALAHAEGTGHEGFRLHVPDPAEAARRLRLRAPLQPGNADLLFVELLRRHPPAGNFAPLESRRYFQLHRVGVVGKAACLAVAAGALTGSALNAASILGVLDETADVRRSVAEITAQLDATLAGDAGNGADPLEMQRIGRAWQLLSEHAVEPADVLGVISSALDANPQVRMERIEWTPVHPVAPDEDGGGEDDTADPSPDPDADAAAPGDTPAGEHRVRLTIRGRVEPFDGNYPLAFREVRTFMHSLEANPRVVAVKALRQPLDISPKSTLTGELTPGTPGDTAGFTLNILLRFGHGPA